MKKKITLLSLSVGVLLFCFSCTSPEKLIKLQESYIPSTISGIYIGMPLKALKEKRGIYNLSLTKKGAVTILKEEYIKDSITLIQYHFN